MAPRNRASNKKKPVAAATSSKPKPKKKDSVVVNPLAKLDDKSVVASIAILGERRDNAVRILNKGCPNFDLATRIPKLLKDDPGYSVCISGGSPELSLDAKSSKPNLIVILVPNSKLPPPFVALFHQERIDYPGALQAPALLAPSGASCLSVEIGQAHDQDCDQGAQ